mmetsp:Transcript_2998/g.4561  ORF Transcript_2998/g.4561 Transcript_2998/m.4561 type:complete len:301 (-) Transcript_2998:371-1273(-)
MSYHSSVESISSIILISLFILSISSSIYVIIRITKIGALTISAKLVLYLHTACILWTLSKLPFIYDNTPPSCVIMGVIYWYCTFFMRLVSYLMVSSMNLRVLMSLGVVTADEKIDISFTLKILLFLLPCLPVIYPLITHSYVAVNNWCDVSRERDSGVISRTIFIAISFVLQSVTLYKLIVVVWGMRGLDKSQYDEMIVKLFRGPGTYPIVNMALTLMADSIIVWEHTTREHESDRRNYYTEYSLLVIQCMCGILFFIIFRLEEANIKAFEVYFRDMKEYEQLLLAEKESTISSVVYHVV